VPDELLVGGVEAEPERQLLELHHRHRPPLSQALIHRLQHPNPPGDS
jgi:hypothetical protein